MTDAVIDLRSDTLSMPTEEMLQSTLTAALGDDSRDGDPTVMELEALGAEIVGKELLPHLVVEVGVGVVEERRDIVLRRPEAGALEVDDPEAILPELQVL